MFNKEVFFATFVFFESVYYLRKHAFL